MTPTPGVVKRSGRAALMGKKRENLAFHGFIGGSSYIQDELGHKQQAEMSREFLRAAAKVELADNITDQQINDWYDAAVQHGATGGKICGAGGGGFMLFYVPKDRQGEMLEYMPLKFIPFKITNKGTEVICE